MWEGRRPSALDRPRWNEGCTACVISISLVHRGETDLALDWIERTYEAGWRFRFLETMVLYESLRGEPRFQRVLERIRADVAAMRERLATDPAGWP